MLSAIVGVELAIDRVEATRKLSQNRSAEDRAGVVAGLSASPSSADREMADLMMRTAAPT